MMVLPMRGVIKQCSACKRQILVERVLIGTDHDMEIVTTCWECMSEENKQKAIEAYKLEVPQTG